MTKQDCTYYQWAYTSASNYTKQVKIWMTSDYGTGQPHYFLDNGAECTNLVSRDPEIGLVYQGGGWLETILGKSIKANSKDINKIQKTILYGAAAIAILALIAPAVVKWIKTHKKYE